MNKIEYIIIHYEGNPSGIASNFSVVNEHHRQLGYPVSEWGFFCGYNDWIEVDGTIIHARKIGEKTAQCIGKNENSYSIAFSGNQPNLKQLTAIENRIREVYDQHPVPLANIGPHRSYYPNRTCYGFSLLENHFREVIRKHINQKITLLQRIADLWQKLVDLRKQAKFSGENKPCWMEKNYEYN